MSIELNNKVCRNLPDQVQKNMEDIKNITENLEDYATVDYVDTELAKKANKDDTVLTGTTHAENIIVDGDSVLEDVEITGSITVPIPVNTYDAANKGYVDGKLISIMNYKGSKTNYADLPASGNQVGDVWNVVNAYSTYPAGTNYAWNGLGWDPLGGSIDLSAYATHTELQQGLATKIASGAISASASEVAGASEAKSINIEGTNYNFPSGGDETKWYKHKIGISVINIEFISTVATPSTWDDTVSGWKVYNGVIIPMTTFSGNAASGGQAVCKFSIVPNGNAITQVWYFNAGSFTQNTAIMQSNWSDTVTEL